MGHITRTQARRLSRTVALGATLVMATAGITMAGLDTGELPVAGFTHTSLVDDRVEPSGLAAAAFAERVASNDAAVRLEMSGSIAAETTYTLQPADYGYRLGWHYHNGPVIFTVTTGTLTFVDDACQAFDLVAGHSYIGSTDQVLNALVLPEKNPGVPAVGWFTTRLSPEGAADPVAVDAPCVM
jgi:quercetin dioxygenase-like cupin family protein